MCENGTLTARANAEHLQALLAEMTDRWERERARADNLALALDTNRMIGAAVGLVMARYHLSEAASFEVLVQLSQIENRKLRDLARQLVQLHSPAQVPAPNRPSPLNQSLTKVTNQMPMTHGGPPSNHALTSRP